MGLLVQLCAGMRGPLNQPARQHTVSHLHILTRLLPLTMSSAIACMRWTFADSIASVGPFINQHGLQPPTDLARLILHNLGITDGDDVVVVGHPVYLFSHWGHSAPGHCLFWCRGGPPFLLLLIPLLRSPFAAREPCSKCNKDKLLRASKAIPLSRSYS